MRTLPTSTSVERSQQSRSSAPLFLLLRAVVQANGHARTEPITELNGCAQWDIRTLAGHIVGEAVWFPNLTRGVTQHEAPYPSVLYASLRSLPPHDLTDRLQEAADALPREIDAASPAQL